MGDLVKFKRPSLKQKAQGRTLCNAGFHKWQLDQRKQFDVRQGRLVSVRRCQRCGLSKTTLD